MEAAYNPNMPFKWNASRIQVLPNQRGGGSGGGNQGSGSNNSNNQSSMSHVNPTPMQNNMAFSNMGNVGQVHY